MDIKLRMGETVIKKGSANHFLGIEGVGGRLYITNQRVYFKAHPINIQTHELTIELKDIQEYGVRSTMGIIPNGLFIQSKNGELDKFVVNRRKSWVHELELLFRDKIIS